MRVFVLAELYEKMIAANRTENSVKRMLSLKRILHDLPTHHFDTFHYLAEHLHRVQLHSDKNKMDVHNIAIVFGPTLMWEEVDKQDMAIAMQTGHVIEHLLQDYKQIFT